MKLKIPSSFDLGPHKIKTQYVQKCSNCGDDVDGQAIYSRNLIELKIGKYDRQYKTFVFCHEWVHHMLMFLGYRKLASDEAFVDRLAGAIQQSLETME